MMRQIPLLLVACSAAACQSEPHASSQASTENRAAPVEKDDDVQQPVAEANNPTAAPAKHETSAGACHVQEGRELRRMLLRGIGTEPFWGVRIEGRCVTYSHPDDQAGTRVWTKFAGSAEEGSWTGMLRGKPFVLRTRAERGCSDGMSDNRYPIAVSLSVDGEERQGCAEPL